MDVPLKSKGGSAREGPVNRALRFRGRRCTWWWQNGWSGRRLKTASPSRAPVLSGRPVVEFWVRRDPIQDAFLSPTNEQWPFSKAGLTTFHQRLDKGAERRIHPVLPACSRGSSQHERRIPARQSHGPLKAALQQLWGAFHFSTGPFQVQIALRLSRCKSLSPHNLMAAPYCTHDLQCTYRRRSPRGQLAESLQQFILTLYEGDARRPCFFPELFAAPAPVDEGALKDRSCSKQVRSLSRGKRDMPHQLKLAVFWP